MTSGFYWTAILGTIISFFVGCIWYSALFGKTWQKEMGLSDADIKKIFVPKKMLIAFVSEWIAGFCITGLLFNLDVSLLVKFLMISVVLVFQGIKLSIFDGKNVKVILINESYRVITVGIFTILFNFFM